MAEQVPRAVRLLRPLGWLVLATAVGTAVWLWATSIETREVTRRIIGHASLTWHDEVRTVSWPKIAGGIGALVIGASLAAALRALAWLSDRRV